jgi:hypothetical protein
VPVVGLWLDSSTYLPMATGVVKMVAPSLATSIRGSVYPLFTPWPGHTAPISPNAHQFGKSERLPQNISFGPGVSTGRAPFRSGYKPSNLLMHIDLPKTTALPPKIFCQDALSVVTVPERGSNSPSYLLNAQRLGKNGRLTSKKFALEKFTYPDTSQSSSKSGTAPLLTAIRIRRISIYSTEAWQ